LSNASDRGWGNPDYSRYEEKFIVTINVGGVKVRVHKEVAKIFTYLLSELEKTYPLAAYKDDWGYANRDVRGHPGVKSNHAWGLAVDLDATKNPMTTNAKAQHEFKAAVVDPILKHFRGRMEWGGKYKGARKDYMHFEWVGTPQDARIITRQMGL
jgi:hypothetical protein